MISFSFDGVDEANIKFGRIANELPTRFLRKLVVETCVILQRAIKRKLTNEVLRVQTGNLRRSIDFDISGEKGNISGKVGTREIVYARIHEYGGIIRPKIAKALRFPIVPGGVGIRQIPKNAKWVTTQKVVIPARPYVKPSAVESRNDIKQHLNQLTEFFLNGN